MKKAIAKIKASLTHNVGIKIVALVVAALIWLTVINMTDPEKTVMIYGIPVEITHEDAISDMEMVYEVRSDKYVNITISGKRSVVSGLSADDFKATASLKELSKVNSVPIEVVAKQGSKARKVTIEKQSVQTLMIEVEQIKKENFDIQVEYSGKAAAGFVPSKYTLSKNNVSITAPNSILNSIDRVVAECELEGNSTDFTNKCRLLLYDSKGNIIRTKHVKMSSRQVYVTVQIDEEKEVPIEIGNIGKPAKGYEIKSTILSLDKVKLVGDNEVLNNIDRILLEKDIDISKAKDEYTKTFDLKKYIPAGVTINGETTVKIEIEIGKMATKNFEINASDIEIKNQGENKIRIMDNVKVTLQGENEVISKISSKDIKASINVDKLDKGEHSIPLNLKVPEGTMVMEDVNVKIKIK
ncbi:MAG: hypothetical protein HFG29_04645 [Eubacterium sp.]|nr:hypothetical protein [Eubacterium sp.]